LRNIVETYLAH